VSTITMTTALRPPAGALRRVRLRDGRTVSIRAIEPGDAERLREFDGGLSETSRRLRYLSWMPPMSHERALALATVDGVDRIAMVATVGHGGHERIVADCRLVPQAGPGRQAEVAIAVADDHRRAGLGAVLLRLALAAAVDAGYDEVVAQVRYDNVVMMRLLRTLGFRRTAWELGVVTYIRSVDHARESPGTP
jgi:RimJ/RimL family protein N-acetyltransferase